MTLHVMVICPGDIDAPVHELWKSPPVLQCGTLKMSKDDSENEEMRELQTPKISEALHSISEVMNWMETQSDCDHLHILHL
jgi:hypothetical protein